MPSHAGYLAMCLPQVEVIVRELLIRPDALVLAVLPRQAAVAVRRGGRARGQWRGRGRRAAAVVAALRDAVLTVAVGGSPALLPARMCCVAKLCYA